MSLMPRCILPTRLRMVARPCGLSAPTLATRSSRLPHLALSHSRWFAGACKHPDRAVFLDLEPFQDEPIVKVEEPRAQLLDYIHKKTALPLPPMRPSRFSCELITIRPCALRISHSPLTGPGWPRSVHNPMFHSKASSQTPASTQVPFPDPGAPWLEHDEYFDKNMWEFDKKATAFAQELTATEWESAKEGLAVLPMQTSLLGRTPNSGPKLVTRQCVRDLWEEVLRQLEGNGVTKVAIIGNPGIGKSRGLTYGLRLLLGGKSAVGETRAPQNKVIIYECRKDREVSAFVPPGQDLRGNAVNNSYQVYRIGLTTFLPEDCVALVSNHRGASLSS